MRIAIKNMPLDYLKSQPDSFFRSDYYLKMNDVFNKYKNDVKHDEGESLEMATLPIDLLVRYMVAKFNEEEFVFQTDEERTDYIFMSMKGINSRGTLFTPKRFITRSASQNKPTKFAFTLVTSAENVFYQDFQRGFQKVKETIGRNTDSEKLAPKPTADPLYDISRKANFYENTLDLGVYDDNEYSKKVLRASMVDQVTSSLTALPTNNLVHRLPTLYPAAIKDMEKRCEELMDYMFKKYRDSALDPDYNNGSLNLATQKYEEPAEFDMSVIEATLSMKLGKFPLSISRTVAVAVTSMVVTHTRRSDKFIVECYTLDGLQLSEDDYTVTVIDDLNYRVDFSDNIEEFTGEIVALFDRQVPERINQYSLFNYISDNGNDKFELYTTNNIYGEVSRLDAYGMNIGYFFYSARLVESKKLVRAKAIKVEKDRAYFDFSEHDGQIEIAILPTYKLLSSLSRVKVSEKNVIEVISTIDIFDPLTSSEVYSND